jgi:hypothetical protein
MLNPLINTDPSHRPDAPFRKYDKTDESVWNDGYESGFNWPVRWNHLPGGPWFPREASVNHMSHPDWVAYVALLKHHNKVWLEGWHRGFKEAAIVRPEIRKMRDKLVLQKLAV